MIYFRPDANSLTAQRARDGEAKLRQEVCDLCDVIFNLGTNTCGGMSKIQFGELFQVIYIIIYIYIITGAVKCIIICLRLQIKLVIF